jgi:hypothetical protein
LDKWRSTVGYSGASCKGVNHAINGIRVFLRWAFFQGIIPNDPTISFKLTNPSNNPPDSQISILFLTTACSFFIDIVFSYSQRFKK